MRCNWRRWLWGVIPLVGASVAAVHLERGAIEKDLTDRAERALAASGARWAVVNFSGRDVVLTGNASAENEPSDAAAVLRNVWGVRRVNNNAGLPAVVAPYVWFARRRTDQVRLYGYVPNRATRQTIIGMTTAALPGLEVVDRMRVGRGVPPTDTWLAGLSFGLKQLAGLKKGEARLEDLALTISGEAESFAEYRMVSAALKGGLPKGITLANAQVAAPVVSPYTWSAQFAGGQLVLSGHVASEKTRNELLAAAKATPAVTDVADRLETARGAPDDFASAAAALINGIVKLQSGNAEMKDVAVTVAGVAADEAQAKAVREALSASLPSNFKLTDQIRVREPPKVEPRAEPKAPAEQQHASPGPPVKADVQPAPVAPAESQSKAEAPPAPAPPAPVEPQVKAEAPPAPAAAAPAEPQVKAEAPPAAAPPAPAEPQVKAEAPPAPAPAAPAEPQAKAQPAAEPPAPAAKQSAATEQAKEEAAPPAASAKEARMAATAVPPAPKPSPAEPAPPAASPDTAAAAPAVPTAPTEAAPTATVPPAPDATPKAAPDPSPSTFAVCREELAKLAAASPITFERGSAIVDAEGLATVAKIAAAVKACPGVRIAAEGHTDIEGSPDYNERLAIKRARAVAACLIKAGVGPDQIETAGFGSSRPAAPNTTAQARAKNRRTEILVRH